MTDARQKKGIALEWFRVCEPQQSIANVALGHQRMTSRTSASTLWRGCLNQAYELVLRAEIPYPTGQPSGALTPTQQATVIGCLLPSLQSRRNYPWVVSLSPVSRAS